MDEINIRDIKTLHDTLDRVKAKRVIAISQMDNKKEVSVAEKETHLLTKSIGELFKLYNFYRLKEA